MASNRFAVIQEEYEQVEPEILGPVLERSLGLVRYDAMHKAREGKGIIAENLNLSHAQALESELKQAGIASRRLPQEKVIEIRKPAVVRLLGIKDDALYVTLGYTGAGEPVPWTEIILLSAGEIVEVHRRRMVTKRRRKRGLLRGAAMTVMFGPVVGRLVSSAVSPSSGRPKVSTTVKKEKKTVQLADVFAGTPGGPFMHARLRARQLYYDQILGNKKVGRFLEDFRTVLAMLAFHAKNAVVTPGYRALVLAGHDPQVDESDAYFGVESEFTQYNRWQLQMLMLEQ